MQIQRFDFINVSREFAMARFVQPQLASSNAMSLPGQHGTLQSKDRTLEGSRTLAAMLMAAVLAALLVVADQLIETWADGHLLLAWVSLWTVAFASLALLAAPLRRVASQGAVLLGTWWLAYQQERREEAMWEYAKQDPRIMAELQAAHSRQSAH
jgi:hypothetical protein